MKTLVTQKYKVTTTDGKTVEVCCAPAMVALPIKSYKPIGVARRDVCCHKGRTAGLCRKGNATLREYLKEHRWLIRP